MDITTSVGVVNVIDFNEYMEDKKRIKQLEKKILTLNKTISRLREKLGISPEINKAKLVELLISGIPARQAAKESKCSRSTAESVLRDLREAGAVTRKKWAHKKAG